MRPVSVTNEIGFNNAVTLDTVMLYPLLAMGGISPSMSLGEMNTRPALLISVTDREGCKGWGEIWANFPPRANIHKMHLIEDVVAPSLVGHTFVDPREVSLYLRETLSIYFLHIGQEKVFEHILAGLDLALWDLALRSAGRSFAEHMKIGTQARCYASSINPDDLEEKLAELGRSGQDHFKLKLGFGNDEDYALVERASQIRPQNVGILVDSNQCWSLSQATSMLTRLEEFDLHLAEEPIPANAALRDWETLARSTVTPLAAGENIYGIEQFLSVANAGVRYLQPDVAKWGGISGAIELAGSLPDSIHLWPHFMGTAVGQIAALSVAAAIGDEFSCEMDVNVNPLRTELCGDILRVQAGGIQLPSEPGLVTPPHTDALEKYGDVANAKVGHELKCN